MHIHIGSRAKRPLWTTYLILILSSFHFVFLHRLNMYTNHLHDKRRRDMRTFEKDLYLHELKN